MSIISDMKVLVGASSSSTASVPASTPPQATPQAAPTKDDAYSQFMKEMHQLIN